MRIFGMLSLSGRRLRDPIRPAPRGNARFRRRREELETSRRGRSEWCGQEAVRWWCGVVVEKREDRGKKDQKVCLCYGVIVPFPFPSQCANFLHFVPFELELRGFCFYCYFSSFPSCSFTWICAKTKGPSHGSRNHVHESQSPMRMSPPGALFPSERVLRSLEGQSCRTRCRSRRGHGSRRANISAFIMAHFDHPHPPMKMSSSKESYPSERISDPLEVQSGRTGERSR